MFLDKVRNALRVGGVSLLLGKVAYKGLSFLKGNIPAQQYAKYEFLFLNGYWPDFESPRSFNEKIAVRKIRRPHKLSTIVADKWSVREYVQDKGLSSILPHVLWCGDRVDEIPFETFPDKFVVKATHGSGWNIIVEDKEAIDIDQIKAQCKQWLAARYSSNLRETHYDEIKPRIIIEAFILDDVYGVPLDFKFFCFNGKAHFVQVDAGRYVTHTRNIYDMSWEEMPFVFGFPRGEIIAKPEKFDKMIEIAEQLSGDFDYCRIDLYCQNDDRLFFGEITLTPEAGLGRFSPGEWDFKMGALWQQ